MTALHKQMNLIAIVIATVISLSLAACTEKAGDSSHAETGVSAMSEDRIAQLQREAQEGDPDAQYSLGYMYENGIGVPKNETKAVEFYQKAADQGHSEARNNLDAMSPLR